MKLTDLRATARQGWRVIMATLHNSLAAVGLAAIAFVGLDGTTLIQAATEPLPTVVAAAVPPSEPEPPALLAPDVDPRHRALATQVAKKYRVAADAAEDLVAEAFAAGKSTGLDPLLILAVISVESRFNPIAESDYGARGLMQVVPRFHMDKISLHGGEDAVLDPRTNIRVGTTVLKEYLRRTGSVEGGMQMYAGALDDPNGVYTQLVMNEKQWLERVRLPVRRPANAA